jgi:hypothetical protein
MAFNAVYKLYIHAMVILNDVSIISFAAATASLLIMRPLASAAFHYENQLK